MGFAIPTHILAIMDRLEDRGYEAWAVGGCIRDSLLGAAVHDWDLCTNALPQETAQVFHDCRLVLAGLKHGTVGVVTEHEVVEITTFRSEGDYTDNRHPGWVRFETNIKADLARRDFTVNAMAYRPRCGLADPFGGQEDLKNRILRTVGQPEARFQEDGLRILRGVRFAARFGLTPEPQTLNAMCSLAPLLALQARERVFSELCGYLPHAKVKDLTLFAPVLAEAIPELKPLCGFQQHNPHHIYDVYTHTAHVVEGVPPALPLRWAALLHDIGKPRTFKLDEDGVGHFKNHAYVGSKMAWEILTQLHAPTALREEVRTLVAFHSLTRDMSQYPQDRPIRRVLRRLGEPTLRNLIALDRADDGGKGTPADPAPFDRFEAHLNAILAQHPCLKVSDLALGGKELIATGIPQGPMLGKILNRLLKEVGDGILENDPQILCSRALTLWEEIEPCTKQSK